MKNHSRIAVSAANALALTWLALFVRPSLAQPGSPPTVSLTFEQWLATPGPAPDVATFAGSVNGDVHGRLVARVLERVEVGPALVELKARYIVYCSDDPSAGPLLVAELEGVQDGTVASLAGKVLEGWLAGATVTVRFEAMDCAPGRERCSRGTLNVYAVPPSAWRFSCRKWVTDWPRMAGVIDEGDPNAGTFVGEVLAAAPSTDGKRLHLIASYAIAAGDKTFHAWVEGDQDNETGRSVLIGFVTSGWYRGAWVRAEYQLTTCDGHDPCWQGSITVAAVPPAIQPTTAFQHTAVHRDRSSSFAVSATGVAPMTVQWRRDGTALPGRTNRTLVIWPAQPTDEGDYTVELRNPGGTVVSPSARLAVVPPTAEYLKRNFTNAAGVRIPYVIHAPADYHPSRRYPLVCFLHGMGWSESALPAGFEEWPNVVAVTSYRQQATDPAIMVWPLGRGGADWSPAVLRQVLDLLNHLAIEFSLDPERFYVGGYSAGVTGVWDLLGLRPGFFAGALVWAGGAGITPATTLKNIPSWAFHAKDDSYGVSGSQNLIAALREAGGRPLLSEFQTGGHEGPMRVASCSPVVLNWLFSQRRSQHLPPPFAVEVAGPDGPPPTATGASSVDLAGTARALAGNITAIAWENRANRAKGVASTDRPADTTFWVVDDLPLAPGKTNVIVLTATLDTTWAPAFGGTTTFSDTLSVFSTPVRLSLTRQGKDAILDWTGGVPPFTVQSAPTVDPAAWADQLQNATPPATLLAPGPMQFYRITGQ